MLVLGSLAFLTPWALAALVVLPALWWLLRMTPPRPRRILFAPLRLLAGLKEHEETPHKTPWWLLLLRLAIAFGIITAFARPVLNPNAETAAKNSLLVVIIDTGWASANHWNVRIERLEQLLENAKNRGRRVILAPTAFTGTRPELIPLGAEQAKTLAATLRPLPYPPQRLQTASTLQKALKNEQNIELHWLASGIDYGQIAQFTAKLARLNAQITVYKSLPGWDIQALSPPAPQAAGLKLRVLRAGGQASAHTGQIRAYAHDGRYLGDTPYLIESGKTQTSVSIDLPLQLRNAVSRLAITGGGTAASVVLLDDRNRRKPIGLLVDEQRADQPLLAPLYYVERALAPGSRIAKKASASELATTDNAIIIMADTGRLPEQGFAKVSGWVEKGGMLIRFAGPRIAAGADGLIPVRLRIGGRSLGGALSWDTPQRLGPFAGSGPFAGLNPPAEVSVTRQVLAEPSLDLNKKTWARLEDGTPLVTAARKGKGWVILFHTSANTAWSSLPLSGLFVQMLQRLVALAPGFSPGIPKAPDARTITANTALLVPNRTLNGYGELTKPPLGAKPLDLKLAGKTAPGPLHPPGFYGPPSRSYAYNLLKSNAVLRPLGKIKNARNIEYSAPAQQELGRYFLLAATILFLIDALLLLVLSGNIARRAAPLGVILLAISFGIQPAGANDERAIKATSNAALAYIRTGDQAIDAISRAGLENLGNIIARRTAFEPSPPMAVDPERDELVFFPFLYWPVTADAKIPGSAALARIDAYMKNGGTILFDTRDQQLARPDINGNITGPNAKILRQILKRLDIPPLIQVPPEHVLTKSFYLLQGFPGRWQDGALWTEAQYANRVSGILIGSNDYAAAWASNDRGEWLYPVSSGNPRQRETAIRAGINIVLYALTGNYKADQVHIPAILERLGQ